MIRISDSVDLEDAIIAPGLLELQTNGLLGFHFTHLKEPNAYHAEVDKVARYLVTQGVTSFWATIPTCKTSDFQRVGALLLWHIVLQTCFPRHGLFALPRALA